MDRLFIVLTLAFVAIQTSFLDNEHSLRQTFEQLNHWQQSIHSSLTAGKATSEQLSGSDYQPPSQDIPCGDLLKRYASSHPKLKFVSCQPGSPNGQAAVVATYEVRGDDSYEVEEFLVEHYGMGNLVWACCGWESQRFGSFTHKDITDANPHYNVLISMGASGEDYLDQGLGRSPVRFRVTVEIAEV